MIILEKLNHYYEKATHVWTKIITKEVVWPIFNEV